MKNLSLSLVLLAACGSGQDGGTMPVTENAPEATPVEAIATNTESVDEAGWTLTDVKGATVSLASLQGKTVVMEWFNPSCPFSVYAHGEGPLRDLPGRVTASGDVVWLAINSSAQGAGAPLAANQKAIADWGMSYPVLMDSDGTVGRMYGAKTTPHIFILDGSGEVVYKGALDNAPRGEVEGEYVNYVEAALADMAAGRPIANAETKSYGCGVKY